MGPALSLSVFVGVMALPCTADGKHGQRPDFRSSRKATAAIPLSKRLRGSSTMLELSPLSMGHAGKARGASTEARCTVSSEKVNILVVVPTYT